ncbi:MAG TPA: zinc ribbon domain-containing protein [Gaiellaceae bacterium]|nr:zinc ribbon domain-containing protein [Gaiellaceae bacterium]
MPERCPACGAPAQDDQEYCLDCGVRLVPGRRLGGLGYAWERRFGRYPGDWVVAALLLLPVAAGSATAGIVAGRDTGPRIGSATVVATSPVVEAPPAPPVQPEPTTTAATTPARRPPPKPPAGRPGLLTWPAKDGYTVVISSIPARGNGLAEATAKAREALARGLRAGVLDSGKFASLHPGYYVVFAGVYGSLDDAQRAARSMAAKYPNVYARQVAR